jgi:hypothetical protein
MMNKQFAELQVYPIGGGIAFGLPGTTTPFLALPSGQATIKPWGTSGFLFENILTGDVIAFVAEYDDVLDNSDAPYGGDQQTVFIALAAFFFDLGGGGSQDLAGVLGVGNTSGSNDISFDAFYGLFFANASRLREGTIDAGLGGDRGIAEICGVGFESKWEAGRRYIMGSSGNTIRQSLYNFTTTPTVNDDDTLGYQIGSLWTLDDGTTYVCSDATTGAAVWAIQEYDFIGFDTSAAHSVGVGELAWNSTDGTLDLGLQGGLKNKVGQQLVVKARNTSGSLISKGSVVKVVGVAGGFIGINLAQADNDTNSETAFGIVAEDIADSSNGFVTINGIIHGLNTNAFTEGDILYLSPTVAGEITNVKPVSPAHAVVVGYCAKKSAGDGHILLHVQNGYELDELHNVSITTPANGNFLEYNGTLWVNRGIIYTVELMDTLTVDFYAPYDLKINTTTNIKNAPTITIQDDGAAYTLTNTIAVGSKITVTASVAGVTNLNITKA